MKRPLRSSISIFSLLLVVLCLSALTACDASKKLMKDAQTLESGGLNAEAYEKYAFIYQNYSNANARVGMKRVAQQILTSKSQKAQMLCMSENYEAAFTAYEDAIHFYQQNTDLELSQSINLMESFTDCKSRYIDMLYNQAEDAVRNDQYDKANTLIRKIYAVDRNNQRAIYLEMMCDILPNYNAGQLAFDKGMYREAYVYFDEVCKIDAGFKDARSMRDECVKRGSYSIVYRVIDNETLADIYEESIASAVKGKLLNQSNPFMELLERDQMDMIFQELQETLSPEYDNEGGAESGKLKRARFILAGELISLEYRTTPETTSKCDCYATYRIYSDKVNCYQYVQSSTIAATYKFKLLDAETGKLYKSDILHFDLNDQGKRYSYEIQKKISLTSPTLTKDHDVNLANKVEPEVDQLLTKAEMFSRMYEYFAGEVSKTMANFRP
ncbi:MAG: hypothetical protein K1X54_14450 [Flavobacteriales bacterium]|nr:hypothetical protein [Flavobacteriales bacterium]